MARSRWKKPVCRGLAAHCVVPASHTGLVFSAHAARQAAHFLREGRFDSGP